MSERRRHSPSIGSKYNTKAIKNKAANQAAIAFQSAGFKKISSSQSAAESAKENQISNVVSNPSQKTRTDNPTSDSPVQVNTIEYNPIQAKKSSWFVLSDRGIISFIFKFLILHVVGNENIQEDMIKSVKDIIKSCNSLEPFPDQNDFSVNPPSVGQISFTNRYNYSAFFLWFPESSSMRRYRALINVPNH